jgi:RNA polymerase sigma factor (sigma-70 family)
MNPPCQLDYEKICDNAITPIARIGLLRLVDRDDLIGAGRLAVLEAQSKRDDIGEGLAVLIARNAMYDRLREEKREVEMGGFGGLKPSGDSKSSGADDTDSGSASDRQQFNLLEKREGNEGSRADDRKKVWARIDSLPDEERVVFRMHMDGETQKQIAAKLGTSQTMVSRKLQSAKAFLKGSLKEDWRPPDAV